MPCLEFFGREFGVRLAKGRDIPKAREPEAVYALRRWLILYDARRSHNLPRVNQARRRSNGKRLFPRGLSFDITVEMAHQRQQMLYPILIRSVLPCRAARQQAVPIRAQRGDIDAAV